jgi:tetratricopeptide (TPR) repeat protein
MAKQTQKKKVIKDKSGKSSGVNFEHEEQIKKNNKYDKFAFNFRNRMFRASIPFVIAFIFYALIWIIPPGPPVEDPWYKAVKLVDSSKKLNNPKMKNKLLKSAGNELKHLVDIHPYHAKVHFFLGYYYFVKQNWDSALVELEEAARIDSGSTINSIWPNAHDLITKAAINKSMNLMNQGKVNRAREILLDAYKYGKYDPLLNKFIGNFYLNTKEYDNALQHLMISMNRNPKDPDTANLIGVVYKMKGDINNALAYFRHALQLNPDHNGAKNNLASITN